MQPPKRTARPSIPNDPVDTDGPAISGAHDVDSVLRRLADDPHSDAGGSALRASEGRFRAMFEGSPIGTALLDLEGRYIAANPALQTMLGYTSDELSGEFVWDQYPGVTQCLPCQTRE